MDRLATLALVLATLSLYWIVPELPFAHLDNPGHWGLIGYFLTLGMVARARLRASRGRGLQRWLLAFLCAMPLFYVAFWLRYSGPRDWLWIELAGVAVYWVLAWIAATLNPWFLALGIGAHAAWDLWHWGRVEFVVDWYALACCVIDVALALYVAAQIPNWLDSRPLQYRR